MSDIKDIRALLVARAEEVCRRLLPDGRRAGRSWVTRCPWRKDDNAGSFAVFVGGAKAGGWIDFATEEKGDIFQLIAGCLSGTPRSKDGFAEALAWARDFLGLQAMGDDQKRRIAEKVAQIQAEKRDQARQEAADVAKRQRAAFGWWLNCEKLENSPGERYLKTRGIDVRALRRPPSIVRFHPHVKHYETKSAWPALVTGMCATNGNVGQVVAVHRTFLKRDGTGKAPVKPVRKIWPEFRGAVMPLARGETDLPVKEAAKQGLLDTLALCEGVEDGLSVALACPDLRVWAVGSLGNLQAVRLPPTTADVIVCADNDWGKPGAEQLLKKGVSAIARQGVDVRIARSAIGKDMNDALMGVA